MIWRNRSITYGERSSPSPGIVMPSGAPQNMTTDIPRTAVGNARGMSSRVSSHFLPLKSLRTMIHAIGSPTRMSMTVTMNAMLNEFHTAPSMTSMLAGSFRTPLTRSHSVKILVTTNIAGMTMIAMKRTMANVSQAFLAL